LAARKLDLQGDRIREGFKAARKLDLQGELLGNWIFKGIGSGRGLRGGCRVKAESDPYN